MVVTVPRIVDAQGIIPVEEMDKRYVLAITMVATALHIVGVEMIAWGTILVEVMDKRYAVEAGVILLIPAKDVSHYRSSFIFLLHNINFHAAVCKRGCNSAHGYCNRPGQCM